MRIRLTLADAAAHLGEGLSPVPSEASAYRDVDGQVAAYWLHQDGVDWIRFPRLASFRVESSHRADCELRVCAYCEPGSSHATVTDLFSRTVIPLLLQANGYQVFHASAVLCAGGVVGFLGRSFAGKSTLACAYAARFGEIWADDSLVIRPQTESLESCRLPDVVPRLRDDVPAEWSGCDSADRGRLAGELLLASGLVELTQMSTAPLRSLVIPRRVDREEQADMLQAERLSDAYAFEQLLANSLYRDLSRENERAQIVQCCLRLAACVPLIEVRYWNGFAHLHDVTTRLCRLIAELP